MQAYVEEIVAKEGYSTPSEYFQELVRQDQKREATERMETLVLEGLESGAATPIEPQDWQDIRAAVRERLAKRSSPNEQ